MNNLIKHIIDELNDIQSGKLWIGSSYESKLNSTDINLVFERPIKNMHSIAEIISHLMLWRKEAILKIKTGTGSKTDDCVENWLANSKLKEKGWNKIKT